MDKVTPRRVTIAMTGVVALLFVMMGFSGCYTVKPGEEAVLQTFGAAHSRTITTEGLHWHWPGPVGDTTVVHTQKIRTAEIGFQTLPGGAIDPFTGQPWQRDLEQATMITGDLNLVEVQMVAQYRISDLRSYLFAADDPGVIFDYYNLDKSQDIQTNRSHPEGLPDGRTLQDALEIAMRRAMGQRTIDQALISEREVVEAETLIFAQDLLNQYRTGIQLVEVQLQEVKAPDAVQEAFDDVLRAREEKDTKINQALSFRSKVLPEARGTAQRLLREAEAYRATRISQAHGEVDRFLAILEQYESAPEIIAERMYLETMDRVLPVLQKVVVPEGSQPIIISDTGREIVPVIVTEEPQE